MKERSIQDKAVKLSGSVTVSAIKELSAERYPFPVSLLSKEKPPKFISRVAQTIKDALAGFNKVT